MLPSSLKINSHSPQFPKTPGGPQDAVCYWPFQGGTSFVDFYVLFLSCVCYAFVRVCLYVPCGHLLGKGWPLGSRLWCTTVSLSLSHWYPWSGVVLDFIDSWSLHPYLLCCKISPNPLKFCLNVFLSCYLRKWVLTFYVSDHKQRTYLEFKVAKSCVMPAIAVERLLTWANRTRIGVAHHVAAQIFYDFNSCYGKHGAVFAVAVATGDIIQLLTSMRQT